MLELKDLTKFYGKTRGINDVDLKINKGEIFGFIGPNGSGKSTTIRCIMNLINKSNGDIIIDNEIIDEKDYKMKENIGYLSSEVNLYDDYTVEEMLKYNASFYKKDSLKKGKSLIKELEVDLGKKIDELSFGNKKKVGIILALMHDPELIILDEATNGLDPLMQEKFYKILKREKNNGKTIFFSSHNLAEIKKVCDRIGFIKEGKIIKVETISKLSDNHFNLITINSKDINKLKKIIIGKVTYEEDNILKIMYEGNINDLIKILNDYEINKLLIEEPSIEEIFMHYYI